jgi:hypothetical protein
MHGVCMAVSSEGTEAEGARPAMRIAQSLTNLTARNSLHVSRRCWRCLSDGIYSIRFGVAVGQPDLGYKPPPLLVELWVDRNVAQRKTPVRNPRKSIDDQELRNSSKRRPLQVAGKPSPTSVRLRPVAAVEPAPTSVEPRRTP